MNKKYELPGYESAEFTDEQKADMQARAKTAIEGCSPALRESFATLLGILGDISILCYQERCSLISGGKTAENIRLLIELIKAQEDAISAHAQSFSESSDRSLADIAAAIESHLKK